MFDIWDATLYCVILLSCFFVFQHSDMLITGGSSFSYLNGHILDFYDVNRQSIGKDVYLPTTYIIFALWNIPIRLLNIVREPSIEVGFVVFWYKLMTTLFFAACAYVIYKIGLVIGAGKRNANLMVILWISSPIAFFSQFIFGQYDVLMLFFTLLGLYHFLKRNTIKFALMFGIAISLKYFPFFTLIPLVLLIEKRIGRVIRIVAIALAPSLAETLLYIRSPAFREGVFGFEALGKFNRAGFEYPGHHVLITNIFIIFWVLICGYCYLKTLKDDNEFHQSALYISLVVPSVLFSLIIWHPQWVLYVTPFMAITTVCHRRSGFFLIVDLVMMYAFIAFTVTYYAKTVDAVLFNEGILGLWKPGVYDLNRHLQMRDLFRCHYVGYCWSLFVGCVLLHVFLKHPGKSSGSWNFDEGYDSIGRNCLYARLRFFLGVMIFIVPAVICLFAPNKDVIKLMLKGFLK